MAKLTRIHLKKKNLPFIYFPATKNEAAYQVFFNKGCIALHQKGVLFFK